MNKIVSGETDSIAEDSASIFAEEDTRHRLRRQSFERIKSDPLDQVEHKLKALWSEYVEHQDRNGFDEQAKALKEKYFSLYRIYRTNKNWKQIVSNNQ